VDDGSAAGSEGVGTGLHVLLRDDQKHAWSAVGLTFLSGGAAVLGGGIVVMCGTPSRAAMGHMLSFAAGVMLYISYADLLPHALAHMEGAHQQPTSIDHHAHHHHNHEHETGSGHGHGHGHEGSLDAFKTTALWFFGGMIVFVAITMLVPEVEVQADDVTTSPAVDHASLATLPPQPTLSRSSSGTPGGVSLATVRKAAEALGLSPAAEATRESLQRHVAAAAAGQLDSLQVVKLRDVAHALGVDIASHSGARKSELQAALRHALANQAPTAQAPDATPASAPPPPPPPAPAAPLRRDPMLTTGLVAAIGISLHNLPEGLIVFNQTITGICAEPPAGQPFDWRLCFGRGMVITLAIALHNIPEGMAVASPLYVATRSRWTAMKYCIFSALCEPVAAIVFGAVFSSFLTPYVLAGINAAVAGIMVALCLVELVPAAADSVGHRGAAVSNIAGQVLMALSLYAMRSTGVH